MQITDRLLDVLRYQLAQEDFTLERSSHADDPLIVAQNGQPLAYIAENGFLWPPVDRPQHIFYLRVAHIAAQVWEMERAYQQGPVMDLPPPYEYHSLLSSMRHVLAARYSGLGQFTFVTWEHAPYDRSRLLNGRYFERNAFAKAKEDFLRRSQLAEGLIHFNSDELCVIRQALLLRGMEDKSLHEAEQEAINHILQRLDAQSLPADRSFWEVEQDMEPEI